MRNSELIKAITNRLEIEFTYKGLLRVVRPGAYGVHHTTNNVFLRGYQIAGQSSSRTPPLWDMYSEDKIDGLVVTDRHFADDPPDYARGDKHMSEIFAEL